MNQEKYIVIFDPASEGHSEGNVELIRDVTKTKARRSALVAGMSVQLQAAGTVRAQVLTGIGAAVATLERREVASLLRDPQVRGVFRSEMRRLPLIQRQVRSKTPKAKWEHSLEQIGLKPSSATGTGIKVAVLDTGVAFGHTDLNIDETLTRSFVPRVKSAQDDHGHGTHCCGIIAGSATPAGGRRYGVAPGVELLVGKVLNNMGAGSDEWILEGINWAVSMGARIISMSLGSTRLPGAKPTEAYELLAQNIGRRGQGTLLIAATGNSSSRPDFVAPVGNPAACASVLGVAAVDTHDQVAPFSCGDVDGIGTVDLAAPGVGILSAIPDLEGNSKNKLERMSGTSMATPHVAAAAALYLEKNPTYTAGQLWDALIEQARQVAGAETDLGAGIVQVP